MLGLQGQGFVPTLFQLKTSLEPPASVTKKPSSTFQRVLTFVLFVPTKFVSKTALCSKSSFSTPSMSKLRI